MCPYPGVYHNLLTPKRTGGYPLMNLAQDYGVDYADVLTWAEYLRLDRVTKGRIPQSRSLDMCEAVTRIHAKIGWARQEKLMHEMVLHANVRWGVPEPIYKL